MIVPHEILKELINTEIESVKGFGFGNVGELKKYMDLKGGNIYPLIWVELPYQSDESKIDLSYREVPVRMFFATTTRIEWLNDKREIETYSKVLRPLYDSFLEVAKKAKQFEFVGREVNAIEQHNWHTSQFEVFEKGNKVNAYWDVISLSFTGRFNNNCKNKCNE